MLYPELISETVLDKLHQPLNYTRIAFSAIARLGRTIYTLEESSEIEDIRQAVFIAALESYRNNENSAECYRRATRAIYHALRALGYKKKGSYQKVELPTDYLNNK